MNQLEKECAALQKLSDYLAAADDGEWEKGKAPDALVLFGGSSLQGAWTLKALKDHFKDAKIILVGGYGHTTCFLEEQMKQILKKWPDTDIREAVLFDQYIQEQFGLKADFLECCSTNCGNNVTYLLELLKRHLPQACRLAIIQDPSMQRRMKAVFAKEAPGMELISVPAIRPEFEVSEGSIRFKEQTLGQWSLEKYAQLLCGEIPRLRNDENGYGPNGKGFIAAVKIPDEIEDAWNTVMQSKIGSFRLADESFSSVRAKEKIPG